MLSRCEEGEIKQKETKVTKFLFEWCVGAPLCTNSQAFLPNNPLVFLVIFC